MTGVVESLNRKEFARNLRPFADMDFDFGNFLLRLPIADFEHLVGRSAVEIGRTEAVQIGAQHDVRRVVTGRRESSGSIFSRRDRGIAR